MKTNQVYTEKISLVEKAAMMLGGMGGVPLFAIISGFLTYFYTNTVGLNAGAVGMIILISKIFDGASDLVLGNVIDKTRTKQGVCRPWVMRISIFGAIGLLALFTVPSIGTTGQLIYVFLSYNISQTLIYTIMQLSLTSLPTYMTRDTVQQTGLFVWSSIGQSIMTIIISSVTLNIVQALGGNQKAWILASCIYAILSAVFIFITGVVCKERVNPDDLTSGEAKVPFLTVLKSIIKNKYWFEVLGIVIFGAGVYVASLQMHTYYAQYVLGDVKLAGMLNMAYTLPLLFVGILLLPLSQHFKKRNIMLTGVAIQLAGCLIIIVIPGSLPVLMAATVMKSIGQSCAATMYMPMLGSAIEYGQWKTGVRSQAALMGANGAGQKIGQGLISAVLGGIMGLAGFNGMAAEQSARAIGSVSSLYLYIPLALTIVEILIVILYDLDKKYDSIMHDLQERQEQKEKE
ncbi:MAG: glycoside-pentoside-hexuronide (GPH):cation symporter [Hespellia sp.]|nr:glycoside-pentoside-hexuronide (GPH):cation symporter [Hespellia sp.]